MKVISKCWPGVGPQTWEKQDILIAYRRADNRDSLERMEVRVGRLETALLALFSEEQLFTAFGLDAEYVVII